MTRVLIVVAAALVVAAGLVAVARWERQRWVNRENAGIRSVFDAVGPLAHANPTGWRFGPPDCVAFSTPANALGLQLCFTASGRVVEAVDRRGPQPVYWSLVDDPKAATLSVPRAVVDRMLPKLSG